MLNAEADSELMPCALYMVEKSGKVVRKSHFCKDHADLLLRFSFSYTHQIQIQINIILKQDHSI